MEAAANGKLDTRGRGGCEETVVTVDHKSWRRQEVEVRYAGAAGGRGRCRRAGTGTGEARRRRAGAVEARRRLRKQLGEACREHMELRVGIQSLCLILY